MGSTCCVDVELSARQLSASYSRPRRHGEYVSVSEATYKHVSHSCFEIDFLGYLAGDSDGKMTKACSDWDRRSLVLGTTRLGGSHCCFAASEKDGGFTEPVQSRKLTLASMLL